MDKAPDAFRTISEVAVELEIPQHVLRFWESRFHEIRPMKRGGGRRFYRPQDVDLLRGIRHLLYGEGYTIRGVQRILREHGQRFVQNVWQPGAPQPTRMPADGSSDESAEPAEVAASAPHEPPQQQLEGAGTAEHAAARAAAGPRLDVRKLEGVIEELAACRALLDAALAEPASGEQTA
jgi:DNA-binding transcriptional MerR regulator